MPAAVSRGERIRTSDLLRPRQARYQAALRPAEKRRGSTRFPGLDQALQTAPPRASRSSGGLSFCSARPRWERRFFSSGPSSANVFPGVSAGRNSGSYPKPCAPRGASAMLPSTRSSARLWDALERREQLRASLGVGGRVARAVHAGRAVQRIDAEPAVVRERPEPALPRAGGGLLRGVVVKGVLRLVRSGQAGVAQGDQLEGDAGEDLPDLDQLPLIRGRDQQLHFTKAPAMAASCFWCSSARPFCAIPTMALSCAGVNGRFSAVPCTSSSSPAAFPTTFMSTSAAKSSS